MNLFNPIESTGVRTGARPSSANIAGQIAIGADIETVRLLGADVAYSFQAVIANGDTCKVEIETNEEDSVVNFDFVAGTAQVETATAAGTVTAAGNAKATITAAGLTGSPLVITFAVANGDTAAQWAAKARAAIAANAAVSALFEVSGTTTAIILTRKPTASYQVGTQTLDVFAANDATLNIALDNDTSTGITPAASSADTTAGVATSGTFAPDANGKDWEGNDIPTGWEIQAIHAKVIEGDCDVTIGSLFTGDLETGESVTITKQTELPSAASAGEIEFESTGVSFVSFTVIGKLP